jgi:hypothetical protein
VGVRTTGTYDWRPCKVLCKKHIFLLLCVCHLAVSFQGVARTIVKSTSAVATRLGRVYCDCDLTGRRVLAYALTLNTSYSYSGREG